MTAALKRAPALLALALVHAYRLLARLRPVPLGGRCKYHPSCSQYALDALRRYGLVRGTVLAGWRLLRCNPWSPGGVDRAEDNRFFPGPRMLITGGILSPIENVLEWLLKALHETLGLPWAWCIVAVTLIVRIALVPLAVKQIHSMQSLQAHAPQMKEIQKKYAHDKQRQNEELMKFYKENRINPAASCLPIAIQIPIFISLFYVLRDFEKQVFPQYPGSSLSWLGFVPNITKGITTHWSGILLLVVYVVSQMASTYFMSTTMQKSQRILMMVLPLVFVIFIIKPPVGGSQHGFPVGLLIYWVTTNLWTVGQGLVTRRLMPKPAPPEKRSSRAPGKEDGGAGDGAKRPQPKPKPVPSAAKPAAAKPAAQKQGGQQPRPVRQKKKRQAPRR